MNNLESRLKELGIEIPAMAPRGVGNYESWVRTGNLVYTSGQFPWRNGVYGDLAYKGRIGKDLDIKQGYDCARLSAITALAQLQQALGNLDAIKKIIRIDGHIQAAEGFKSHSDVLDGASDVFNSLFGARGRHTRSAIGIYQTPLDSPILLYIIAEVEA